MSNKIFAIVPAYNEGRNIKKVILSLLKKTSNIIIVNDGSTDKTKEIINEISLNKSSNNKLNLKLGINIRTIHIKKNIGKGAAMRKGVNLAWKLKAGGIIFIDADNQHDIKHFTDFVKYLEKGHDIILGIRIMKAKIPFVRRVGNETFVFIMGILFNIKMQDFICGFRALSKKGYKQILWESDGYGVEVEMMTIIARKKLTFKTVIVDTIYLDKYKGFSVIDGIKILLRLPYWRLKKL